MIVGDYIIDNCQLTIINLKLICEQHYLLSNLKIN